MVTKYETDVGTESDAPFSKMQVTFDPLTHLITSVDQVIDIYKTENEDEIVDLDNNSESEAPSDMNTQEYLHNGKASDDANFNSNVLSSDVTSEHQSHALDVMKILDRNIVEAAGDENELNNNHGNKNNNGNGNENGNLDDSEGMEATTDSDNIDLWPEYCDPNYRMPGMITVRVTLDLEERRFQVNIIKAVKCSKIYLGGFRNKINGSLYHHASTQTPTIKKDLKDFSNLRTRETQTFETRTLSVQSYREAGTQMERIDVMMDNRNDKEIQPGTYATSYEWAALRRIKCIEIQRYWRGFVARSAAYRLHIRRIDKAEFEKIKKLKLIEEQKVLEEAATFRKNNPRSNSDFTVLYNDLEVWRAKEMETIKCTPSSTEERTEAISAMLGKETKALQRIQKLKFDAQKELSTQRTQQILEQMAEPHQWQLSSGSVAYVQTPATVRAKELRDLYHSISAPLMSSSDVDNRLDVLLNLKGLVKEFDDPLTRDIADLIDREADLLNRARPVKSMEKLRLRLNNLFLQFIDDPHYNPRVADFQSKSS